MERQQASIPAAIPEEAAAPPGPYTVRFVLTIPIVYAGIPLFLALDLFLAIYQWLCFPAWKVPRVERSRYLRFDRSKLPYLNWYQRLNCYYCSYGNGLAAYLVEIAARTEQYWCPIQHRHPPATPHSRYHRFFANGDARTFKQRMEALRDDFSDLD